MAFEKTLKAVEDLQIRCANPECRVESDQLQCLGSSCKHAFCWNCINKFITLDTLPLCPDVKCRIPLEMAENAREGREDILASQHIFLAAVTSGEQRRTVEDFCATQKIAEEDEESDIFAKSPKRSPAESPLKEMKWTTTENRIPPPSPSSFASNERAPTSSTRNTRDDAENTSTAAESSKNSLFASQMPQEWKDEECHESAAFLFQPPSSFEFFKSPPKKTFSKRPFEPTPWFPADKKANLRNKENGEEKEATKLVTGTISKAQTPSRLATNKRAPNSCDVESKGIAERGKSLETAASSETTRPSGKKSLPRGEMPLVNALLSLDVTKVKEAIKAGCDVNERDPQGYTPLQLAAYRDSVALCSLLVEAGAVVDAHGGPICSTALHETVVANAGNAMKYLLSIGASRDERDSHGRVASSLTSNASLQAVIARTRPVSKLSVTTRVRHVSHLVVDFTPNEVEKRHLESLKLSWKTRVDNETSHLVVRADNNTASRTENIQLGILRGVFIVSWNWIEECLRQGRLVDAEPFEVHQIANLLSVFGGAPREARLNRDLMRPPLFQGCHFFLLHQRYTGATRPFLCSLVQAGGGTVVSREPADASPPPFHAPSLNPFFVVYNPLLPVTGRFSREKSNLVTVSWLTQCVVSWKLVLPVY